MRDGTLSEQIAALEKSAEQMSVLATRARNRKNYIKAQELDGKAMVLSAQLGALADELRGKAINSTHWKEVHKHLDALNREADDTRGKVRDAQDTVETAQAIVNIVSRLAGLI